MGINKSRNVVKIHYFLRLIEKRLFNSNYIIFISIEYKIIRKSKM